MSDAGAAQARETIEMFEVITQAVPWDYQSLEILKQAYCRLDRKADVSRTDQRIAEAYLLHGRCHELGRSFEYGSDPVVKDLVEAYAWYNLATKANRALSNNLDNLEKQLSPQQLVAGKQRSDELQAQIEAKWKHGGK